MSILRGIFLIVALAVLVVLAGWFMMSKNQGSPVEIRDQSISGTVKRDQIWSGTIHVTGDVWVKKGVTLTIQPGTEIKVAALSDDQRGGTDHPHDPPFPKDPDRIETKSVQFIINGVLNAVGAPDQRIVFTSDGKRPTTYDWDGLYVSRGRLEYVVVEYARYNNIQESSDVIISNSIFRNSLECCLGIGHSRPVSPQILNNEFYNCGHEGIDNAGGSAIIKGNYFHLENPEIQPDPSMGGYGVIVYQNSYPIIENNRFEELRTAVLFLAAPLYEKGEGEKVILKNNIMKDNDVAFTISPGYPMDAPGEIVRENNTLINNKQDEVREE